MAVARVIMFNKGNRIGPVLGPTGLQKCLRFLKRNRGILDDIFTYELDICGKGKKKK